MLVTRNASNRKYMPSLNTGGGGIGTPQRLSLRLAGKAPFWTRSPATSDSVACSSNGMNGSRSFESDMLVPSASVATLRKRSV
jgi:hypothetical protein